MSIVRLMLSTALSNRVCQMTRPVRFLGLLRGLFLELPRLGVAQGAMSQHCAVARYDGIQGKGWSG